MYLGNGVTLSRYSLSEPRVTKLSIYTHYSWSPWGYTERVIFLGGDMLSPSASIAEMRNAISLYCEATHQTVTATNGGRVYFGDRKYTLFQAYEKATAYLNGDKHA